MDGTEKEIIQMKNDISCLMKFKEEMTMAFNEREPAQKTWDFISTVKIDMALNTKDHQELKEGLKTIEKKLDDVIKEAPTKSNSWAEGVLKIVGYIVLVALVGSFLLLIIKDGLIR
jgi:hypothetical protein